MPRFKVQPCSFWNSSVENFFGNFPKSQINYFSKSSFDAYFKLTGDISLKLARLKNQSANHGAKHRKIWFFCIIATTLTKIGFGEAGCFILYKNFASKFLEK